LKFINSMKKVTYLLTIALTLFVIRPAQAQDKAYILDRVVAVVGDFHVLQSDIELQYLQMKARSPYLPENIKCDILEYFIEQKLMMSQAKIDSIEVSDSQVQLNMESRLNEFIRQFGSEEEMEDYFGKTIFDIREDLTKTMKEMMITGQVQQAIVGDINITPSEVRAFYKSIPEDSIPLIDSEIKLAQIIAYPPVDENAEFEAKERLLNLRKRIIDGESMSTLAILYSDDPSATGNYGEIGYMGKGDGLDPAYADAAFALKEGQISKIIKSSFGYHIIKNLGRKGDRVNTQHILIMPKIDATAKARALAKLDSLKTAIDNDSITFNRAALYYSEDDNTRANGGLMVNPINQAATFKLDELSTKDYYVVRDMKVGDVSAPYETTDSNGKVCYKMVKLLNRTEPHRANMKDDYLMLQNIALSQKQDEVMDDWYKEKRKKTYIKIDGSFQYCEDNQGELSSR